MSLTSATFRWMNHHSAMKPEHKGLYNSICYISTITIDGVIMGGSSLEHIVANIDASEEGPLDQSEWSCDSHVTSCY